MPADTAPSASYRSGDWLAAAGSGLWLLLSCRANDELIPAVWAALARQASAEEVQDLLGAGRHYGLVSVNSDTTLIFLAGSASAELSGPGASGTLSCPAGVSVARYRVDGGVAKISVLGGELADQSSFPLRSGVARAGALYLDWSTASAPSPITADRDPLPSAPPPLLAPPDPSPQQPVGSFDPSLTLDSRLAMDSGLTLQSAPDSPASPEQVTPADDSYSYLFGHTINRSVEDAAVRPAEPPEEPSSSRNPDPELPASPSGPEQPGGPFLTRAEEAPRVEPEPLPVPGASIVGTGPMIDAVPLGGASGSQAPESVGAGAPGRTPFFVPPVSSAAPVAIPATLSDPDLEMTVNRAAHAAALKRMEAPSGSGIPTVHAVRCSTNHPNPPHVGSCRVCAAPIPDQTPITVPRPVLGCLRLSTGDQVALDRGVLIGRGPSEGRLVGGERPHLVKLPSPDHDISRNHVEVRLDGWHVLVTDLHSTNGTLIRRPGTEPERLRPDQPTMIEPGTVVSLSDDIFLTYEVAP